MTEEKKVFVFTYWGSGQVWEDECAYQTREDLDNPPSGKSEKLNGGGTKFVLLTSQSEELRKIGEMELWSMDHVL